MTKRTVVALVCVLLAQLPRLDAQVASNSVVRFRITYGIHALGDVIVELFDQDKPITVSNFLAYVQSRRYDNSVLTRCLPGAIVQGGEYTVDNPYSPGLLQLVHRIPTFPNITNEFRVGTLRSNVLGTLSMAKVFGDANSANSAWFFNLGDNSTNLDNFSGGLVVFGQVKSGQNVLNVFNTLYENHGIINTASNSYDYYCTRIARDPPLPGSDFIDFSDLPVGFFGLDCVWYSDLFAVQITMLNGPDVLPPKLTITSPKLNASLTNDSVTITGTASDNKGVASVRAFLNDNAPVTANGSNRWSVTLTNIPPGTNSVDLEATDLTGNKGHASLTFFHSVRVPLLLDTVGLGTILGATNGQLLELTRPYTLTAKPAPGNLFVAWTGAFAEASATLNFQMDSNLAFTAVFTSNLFPGVKGTYTGLFFNTNLVEQESAGLMTLTLGDAGVYSAKVLLNGSAYKMTGTFAPDGGETNLVLLTDNSSLWFFLAADLVGGTDRITGLATNRNWGFADLTLDRAVFNAATNPAPLRGTYTLLLPPATNSPLSPGGDGFASVKVDAKGGASFSGLLADNTKLALKAPVSKQGILPLYVPLYNKGTGLLVSWVTFDTNPPATDLSGLVNWFKPTQPTAKYYPRGFTNESMLIGSRYLPPTTNRVLNLTNTTLGFVDGNLDPGFTNNIVLDAKNKVTTPDTNKLTLTIAKPTGLFTGSVTPPGQTKALSFKGALLQKQNRGGGLALGTNETSDVSLGP